MDSRRIFRFPLRRNPNFGQLLTEVTTVRDMISGDKNEIVDAIKQTMNREHRETEVKKLIQRCLVLEEMKVTLEQMEKLVKTKDLPALSRHCCQCQPKTLVQYSYNHFPTFRSTIWPNGIENRCDFYFNIKGRDKDTFYREFRKNDADNDDAWHRYQELLDEVKRSRKHPEPLTRVSPQFAEPQGYKTLSDIYEGRVLPGTFSDEEVFKGILWDVRIKPSESTKGVGDPDRILFEGPVLLELPSIAGDIMYRVSVKGRQTAWAILMTIYEFYKSHGSRYTLGDRVWAEALVEGSPNIWTFSLRSGERS
jgi:hypothetical protein